MSRPRVVSMLPSGTEIVAALGLADCLVGRSYECDFPAGLAHLPVCSRPRIPQHLSSEEIDRRVREILMRGESMYTVDVEQLWALAPDVILSQTQCSVCAVTPDDLEVALRDWPDPEARPRVLAVEPDDLDGLWRSVRQTGEALGEPERAHQQVAAWQQRLQRLAARTETRARPRVACLEWTAPLMPAGNWVPELVTLAGGQSLLAEPGRHSPRVGWRELADADPDVVVLAPCGFRLDKVVTALERLQACPEWHALRAVRAAQVYLVDGSQYFNRPGPRLVDTAEILAEILHPEVCDFGRRGSAWIPAPTPAGAVVV